MRRQPRQNVWAAGPKVFQDFSSVDLQGNAYPKSAGVYAPRTIEYGARYGWTLDADGLPAFGLIQGTFGPRGGMLMLPPDTGTARKLVQWSAGGVPCLVTNVSPLKVRPIYKVSGGSPYVTDSTLADIACVAPAWYSSPTVGDPGTLMQASDLQSEQLVFFPDLNPSGGGGGGQAGYYGDGLDGAVTLAFDAFGNITHPDPFATGGSFLFTGELGDYTGVAGQGGWNDDTGTAYWIAVMNRDVYATTFTIPATLTYSNGSAPVTLPVAVVPNGYRIFCTTSLVINGSSKICGDGWLYNGGVGVGPGNGYNYRVGFGLYTTLGIRYPGGVPNGPSPIGIWGPYPQLIANNTGSGAGGGIGGSVPPTGQYQGFSGMPNRQAAAWATDGPVYGSPNYTLGNFAGGCGGGNGIGAGAGAGGAGGMAIVIASPSITGGSITSDGGLGHPATSGNSGGGGGGNPGPIYIITESISSATSSTHGTGGAGSGTGTVGANAGGAGLVRKYQPSTNTYS